MVAESVRHCRDLLFCLNCLVDMSYFAQAAALIIRQYAGVQRRKEDRGMKT
jgi:hypothetical protein